MLEIEKESLIEHQVSGSFILELCDCQRFGQKKFERYISEYFYSDLMLDLYMFQPYSGALTKHVTRDWEVDGRGCRTVIRFELDQAGRRVDVRRAEKPEGRGAGCDVGDGRGL